MTSFVYDIVLPTLYSHHMGMDQYLLIPFLVGWTSIYQLFWCSPGVQGFDTLPYSHHIARSWLCQPPLWRTLETLTHGSPWWNWHLGHGGNWWFHHFYRSKHGGCRWDLWCYAKLRTGSLGKTRVLYGFMGNITRIDDWASSLIVLPKQIELYIWFLKRISHHLSSNLLVDLCRIYYIPILVFLCIYVYTCIYIYVYYVYL